MHAALGSMFYFNNTSVSLVEDLEVLISPWRGNIEFTLKCYAGAKSFLICQNGCSVTGISFPVFRQTFHKLLHQKLQYLIFLVACWIFCTFTFIWWWWVISCIVTSRPLVRGFQLGLSLIQACATGTLGPEMDLIVIPYGCIFSSSLLA